MLVLEADHTPKAETFWNPLNFGQITEEERRPLARESDNIFYVPGWTLFQKLYIYELI